MAERADVLVAVATYLRNQELSSLLPMLRAEADTLVPPAAVLVVDNDPAGGAAAVVAEAGVTYRHEPSPGIAAARNAALDSAVGQYRYLVFIDDDEHPRPGWLRALTDAIVADGAAAVAGAVVSEFETPPDPWVVASGLFRRQRVATGTALAAAATNNLVLDLQRVGPLRFDDRLGLVGGSDHLFTRTLAGLGERLSWCDEAVVVDRVPPERATRLWVRRRAYRIGNSEVVVSLLLARSPGRRARVRARALAGGLARIAAGAGAVALGRLTGRLAREASGSRVLHRGCGHVTGAVGVRYAEYARAPVARRRTRKK